MGASTKYLKEPSSWAGFGVLLSILAPHLGLGIEAVNAIINVAVAVSGAAAVVMKEKAD